MAEKKAPSKASSEVSSDDRLWAALAYVFTPFIPIIIMLMDDKKNRPFIKAHNMQALTYGAGLAIIWTLGTVISFGILALCLTPLMFVGWVAALYWGYKAYQGEMVNIPIVSDFVKNRGWV